MSSLHYKFKSITNSGSPEKKAHRSAMGGSHAVFEAGVENLRTSLDTAQKQYTDEHQKRLKEDPDHVEDKKGKLEEFKRAIDRVESAGKEVFSGYPKSV